MEIRDALAYLRVVNQKDDDLALERIINTPKRGIGDTTVQTLYAHARSKQMSLYDALRDLTQTDELKPKVKATIMKLVDDFERWRGLASNTHHVELTKIILDESGYTAMWQADKSPESPGRLENLKELVSGMEEFENLEAFLEHVSLVMEAQNNDVNADQVTIMTLHGAKGLEFKCVFLPGWEEGLFPSQRSMDENGLKGLEEERRLAYVGITRARERAHISYVANRRMYGSWINAIPSRFVDELPPDDIEMQAETGLYGNTAGRSQHWDSSGFGNDFALRRTKVVEGVGRRVESKPDSGQSISGYARGDKVVHEKFGRGAIVHIDGHKLDIAFEKGGIKRVMDSFITKAD
jgi:DNA helicase-2/ATP-dependent DNA helicase PcrA